MLYDLNTGSVHSISWRSYHSIDFVLNRANDRFHESENRFRYLVTHLVLDRDEKLEGDLDLKATSWLQDLQMLLEDGEARR